MQSTVAVSSSAVLRRLVIRRLANNNYSTYQRLLTVTKPKVFNNSNHLIHKNSLISPISTTWHSQQSLFPVSYFSTETKKSTNEEKEEEEPIVETKNQKEEEEPPQKKKSSSLRDSVNRIQKEEGKDGEDDNTKHDDIFQKMSDLYDTWSETIGSTWQELINAGKPKDINKKLHVIHPTENTDLDSQDDTYTGSVEIMVIDESANLNAWERMQKRLQESPIISNILEKTTQVYEKSGAQKVKERVDHLKEDASEAWETSQNPWVYRASSVYDTLTAESEFTVAVRELRELDPDFTLEEWKTDVVEHTLPQIMTWFLEGRIAQLEPWLGEAVHNRIAAEIKARKQEGVQIDTHVLGIMNSEILACEPDTVNKGSPIIVLHFMCQQINCVTKKEDGSIVEGSEDDIRANSYVCAFQREYNEEKAELNWKIVDFRFNGAIAYL